jgi:hypothetical protein
MLGGMTMWRLSEAVEEDVSNLPGIDPQGKRRRSRRRAWRDGLADQTVVKTLEDVRCYRAFERALIGSVDPRSTLELALVHRLASLLWRLRRASAIETALFEIQGELLLAGQRDTSHRLSQPGTLRTFPQANGHSKSPGSNGRDHHPSAGDQECCQYRSHHGRSPALSPNVSCAFPILTRPCLTAWAAMKRDYGVKRRKRFGPSRRCDSRRLLCGSGCATGSRPSPGIGRGRSRLTRSLDLDCSR